MAEPGELGNLSPLIQVTIGAIIALGAGLSYVFGKRNRNEEGGDNTQQGMYRLLGEIRNDNARFADENNEKLDKQCELLRDIRENQNRRRSL